MKDKPAEVPPAQNAEAADVEGQDGVRDFVEAQSQLHDADILAGDTDVDPYDAEFVGEEAVGGQNPTPDQSVVADIGRAVGIEYQETEWLHTTEKLEERDEHRWELDPESSEDYEDRHPQVS